MHLLRHVTEEEIVSKCKSGSLKHQELLYKRFYGYAMGVGMRYSLNEDDALEVVNDAFLKVFNNITTYNTDRPFKAWLRTIIVNTAIDRRRKELKHQSNTNIEDAYALGTNADIIDTLNAKDILKLMKQLPQIQLTIFNMYEIDGYNHDEISKILNLPASSSRVYLSRAKDKLRQLLTTQTQNHG
jgi:RNA polymerase sigma factor (sigma-70 family)